MPIIGFGQKTVPAVTDTVPADSTKKISVKKQLLERLNTSINNTCSYISSQPADSIDIGLMYALLDILKRKFELPVVMANKNEVEKHFPEIKQGRLKLYKTFYDGNATLPFTKEELDKLNSEPITSLYDDKYLLGTAMFCKELTLPNEYLTTFLARIQKYEEEHQHTGLDPIVAALAYINFADNGCKCNKAQLDTLKSKISKILMEHNAGNLRTVLDLEWFYSGQMNLLGNVLASAMKYYIGECDLFTYKMMFNLFNYQNEDGGWHPLVEKGKSSFSASVAYLWLLTEMRSKIDCIDKVADKSTEPENE